MHRASLRRTAEITHTTDPHCGQAPGWPWRRVLKLADPNTSADCVQKGGKAPTTDPVRGRPVEPRTTSSGSKSSSSGYTAVFSIWFTSNATAALPIDSIGCLTVVSGSVQFLTTPRLVGRGFQPSPAGVPVSSPTASGETQGV